MTGPEALWDQLCSHLDHAGVLPIRSPLFSPAEIARQVASQTGDTRVHRFVWGYYYPHVFGNQKGLLTESQAKALVNSYKKSPPEEEPVTTLETFLPPLEPRDTRLPPCNVCSKRRPAKVKG